MQRFLSLITLGVLGGLGFLFLKGGGFDQFAQQQSGSQQTQVAAPYQSPGTWQQPTTTTPVSSQPAPPPPAVNPGLAGYDNGKVLRIASFNIRDFGNKKAGTRHVMFTLADIVRKFDVVAVQEISSKNEYLVPNFVKLINQSGRHYDHVIGRRIGNTNQKEQYAYIFDMARVEIDHQSVYTIGDPDNLLHREPLVATFRAREAHPSEAFTFTLINIHTDPKPHVLKQELDALAEVYRVVRRTGRGEDDIIILGDFNADDRKMRRLGQIPGIHPVISGVWTNTRQNKQYDNIVVHQPSTTEYNGNSGVFDIMRHYNLTQDQALKVSDHFPVWAEFSIYERDHMGRIAHRRQPVGR